MTRQTYWKLLVHNVAGVYCCTNSSVSNTTPMVFLSLNVVGGIGDELFINRAND